MPRYIDADALRQRMYHEAFETDTDMQKWDSGCWIRYKLFENCIDEMPTISPDEVRGVGEWEKKTICYSQCSNCKKLIKTAELVEYKALDGQGGFCVIPSIEKNDINYCPNCGAKMKGVSEDA